jgi:type IV pilus assembly protein PilW
VLSFLRPETYGSNRPHGKGIGDALVNKNGFTLTEVLVAMAIAGIVMTGVYALFNSQLRAYSSQEEVAAMQKNLRAAMHFLEKDIRMAGCDPTGRAMAGIKVALPSSIRFTMDIRGGSSPESDGDCDDPNEDISYSLYTSSGVKKLGRKSTSTSNNQPVAEHIESLQLMYFDEEGKETSSLSNIRSVQITVTAGVPDARAGDLRTKTLIKQVKCRNLYF